MSSENVTDTDTDTDKPTETKEEKHSFKELTERFTRLLAASTISNPDFPAEHLLPRVARIPYNNLGHQSLVDQILLGKIIWGTLEKLKKSRTTLDNTGSVISASVICALAVGFPFIGAGILVWGIFAAILTGVTIYSLTVKDFSKEAAKIKAEAVRQIIGVSKRRNNLELDFGAESLAVAGSGLLSMEKTLVFFASDRGTRFPGLGWSNAEELFVCPTKSLKSQEHIDGNAVATAVKSSMTNLIAEENTSRMSSGWAVVVDESSVTRNSRWLDKESRPLLEIENPPEEDPLLLDQWDPEASARTYFGVQIFLPEYLTMASVFVRPFMAASSAAFDMTVLTLGPPMSNEGDIRSALHVYDRKRKRDDHGTSSSNDDEKDQSAKSGHTTLLRQIRSAVENVNDPFSKKKDYSSIDDLSWNDGASLSAERRAAEKLQREMQTWVGRFIGEHNWREANSLTITQDFFGSSECRATVRSLYDQVVRHVLESLDELDFDISQYRDSSGRWSISVDKIDQMIVGENVSVQDAKVSDEG